MPEDASPTPAARFSFARWASALIALVLPVLWLAEVRPHLGETWPSSSDQFPLPSYLPGDCPFYRAAIVSLLNDGDLDLRNNVSWSALSPEGHVSLGARGEWYPKHPLALPLAAAPFYALAGDAGLLGFNLLQLLALEVLILFAVGRHCSGPIALVTALAFALGTLLRPAALNFSPDVFSTLLVFGGVLSLLRARAGQAGALLGAAVGAKWTNLAFLPIGLLWCAFAWDIRRALRFALCALPFVAALAALNTQMFGLPWVTPYDRVGVGFLTGLPHLEPSHRQFFDVPFWRGLSTQLFDRRLGLLASAPPLLLAVPGMFLLWRRARAEAALLLAMALAQMAIFAPYRAWDASNFGHRFLMTVVVLGAVPAATMLSRLVGSERDPPLAPPSPGAQ